jgi:hypothetical protein
MDDTEDKVEVKYKRLEKEDPKILQRVSEVYNVETKHAILMVINTFGSSNIKRLAKFLNKNEATIYHHIKELTKEPALLDIDQQKTHSQKGIFYQLSDIAKWYFGEPPLELLETHMQKAYDKILAQSDAEIRIILIDLLRKHPSIGEFARKEKRLLSYNHFLENIMISNLEQAEKAFLKGKEPKGPNYPLGSISNYSLDMKIVKPRHLFEILKILTEMAAKFNRLKEKISEEINESEIPESELVSIHYHIVGGEIAEFEFE